MKKLYFSIILLCLCLVAAAQQFPVKFKTGNYFPSGNIAQNLFVKQSISSSLYGNDYFVLIQLGAIPNKQKNDLLKQAGVKLQQYVGSNTFLASIDKSFVEENLSTLSVQSLDILPVNFKIDPSAKSNIVADKREKEFIAVSYYPSFSKKNAEEALTEAGAIIIKSKYDFANTILIQPDHTIIDALASLPFVNYISRQYTSDKLLNYNSTSAHAVSSLHSSLFNLSGKNITVGVGDNANINTHIDFNNRLINRFAYGPEYHGTHVSGTVGGAGIINPLHKGMAPKSSLVSQVFSDILINTPAYAADYNMVATNNSYYSVAVGCPGEGTYDVLSNYIDSQMQSYNSVLHVIAAGNDGTLTCSPYPASFATVKSGWQTAKNVLTVGNLDLFNYTISFGSSRGPVKDGRLKPEIVASGTNVLSTYINNTYGGFSGTSMASPVITGVIALLQEKYKQLNSNQYAKASLIKALLCNTAEDLGNAGPDFTYGFGMLNTRRAVVAMQNNQYSERTIVQGENQNSNITVPAGTRRLKIMLYWSDAAAAANAANALVNDLDLTVNGASGFHQPLILNATPAGVNNIATEGADHVNNIEQIVINNPTAGVHTVTVNGFAVPSGSQNYVLTWQMDMNGVTVEYPYGGEKWVPGETEIIRWNAYGNEANTFTIEYTLDGTNWNVIDNAVPAASRSYSWAIPPGVLSGTAYIRISRNGTGFTDISDAAFSIAPVATLTITNPCPGYAFLTWPAVSGATSYNILQLVADSMKVIGTTASANYLSGGLSKYNTAWFAVEAVSSSIVSRRSIAKSILPNGGTCAGASFQNDLIVDSILHPVSMRLGYNVANGMNTATPVKVRIINRGNIAVSGPFNVSFSTDGFGSSTETVNTTIAAGGSYEYTFTGSYSVNPGGMIADFKSWVTLAADTNHENDTAYKTVKLLNNDPAILPYSENFETFTNREYFNELGMYGDFIKAGRFDFAANNNNGRARTFVNSGFAFSGNRAITLDRQTAGSTSTTDSLKMSINAMLFPAQTRLEFWYKNHGQDNLPGNKVWMRASESHSWVQVYDLVVNQNGINQWKLAKININDALAAQFPLTNTFQVKFGQEGYTSANSAYQELDVDDGYTFDDIAIFEAQNDLAVQQIINPVSGCGLGAATPVTIRIKNYHTAAVTNIPVSYRINNGAVITETITASIAANATYDYTFTTTANFSAYIDYTLDVWAKLPADTYAGNDTLQKIFHVSPVINNFPYLENFENGNGNYYTKSVSSTPSSWQWGTPANTIINKAPNGSKAWVTNLTGNYRDNEFSYLYTPCFNLSSLTQPVLSFSHIYDIETDYDYTWVEYSADGGVTWNRLGTNTTGVNWYDDPGANRWRLSKTKWHVASIDIPTTASSVSFRFVMASDGGVTQEGVGIDDVHVFDKALIYTGANVTGITQNVNGNTWVHFNSAGRRVASVNANGQNLGSTTADVYMNTGAVRNSNNQFYADRDIVIRPSIQPTLPVNVRFYFTLAEATALLNATGCGTCVKPADAYEIGVTKYSGTAIQENGTLADNDPGIYKFILPANTEIIPYDNGYYAEFTVDNFSEFWLSKGDITPVPSINCAGSIKTYSAAAGGATYQWQENNGTGWINITNGPNYTGAATQNLQVVSIPDYFNGNKYRCLINGVPDAERVLIVGMTWIGGVDSDWFKNDNWSCFGLPTQHSYVLIPGSGPLFYPVVNGNAAVKNLRVQPGASVIVTTGFNLEVKGN